MRRQIYLDYGLALTNYRVLTLRKCVAFESLRFKLG
jgi:hypothetical protein